MKIAFYRARFGTATDWAVAAATFGPYSHCELVFSDGACFSSSARDGGVRFKNILLGGHWVVIMLPMLRVMEDSVRLWSEACVGAGYDWRGMFGAAVHLPGGDAKRWFCSEICIAALQRGYCEQVGTIRASAYSPNALERLLMRRGG